MDRLKRQIGFIVELDKLKTIVRQSWLADGSRRENSAEHSWHVALMALVLSEHANADMDLDLARVVKLLLLHDVVEIDAGDVLIYDVAGNVSKPERERQAAERIYGMLPDDQAAELRALWEEFEMGETTEARFAASLDRLMPLLHNFLTEGRAWRHHGVTADQVLAANARIAAGSTALWDYARGLIDEAVERDYLLPGKE
ncbi:MULTISPECIES: HD domain-containing protein [unclassified Methylocaldum]|jgi:putative hydrolase of HD superfamily|uniref:HD domain-containing protein n=1 Tax=unclassified Methylocaldum TaxID=2622260 RepID=UPI000A328150|nr:HD domain-containing protein [Methylocaldum sp. RMAD-M]MBP1151652.1 putative hydrolase of HD superfamily [Methylocaldum sp. RMAD-M]